MSREVDSRVVEMQFNNENFEKNTKRTIGTIDKLMEKLQFKGAEKGFEKLDAAAEDVDFSTMQRSLDTLESKFSTLHIVATTALMNITNKFVDAGEKMVKSLSFDQVMSGWNKYVEKTGNIQTIMNATGDSIDTVNGYLNKLMWYSDETSFSFNEMTSALSQMTASGGDIKKMIPMIMGIANATADAGKSGFAFQSTIRNLTQSYSAGHLQLQDWKSLNLMGTATKALKQELIDTAVGAGHPEKGRGDHRQLRIQPFAEMGQHEGHGKDLRKVRLHDGSSLRDDPEKPRHDQLGSAGKAERAVWRAGRTKRTGGSTGEELFRSH